jgi:hypothetical protein
VEISGTDSTALSPVCERHPAAPQSASRLDGADSRGRFARLAEYLTASTHKVISPRKSSQASSAHRFYRLCGFDELVELPDMIKEGRNETLLRKVPH